MRDVQTRCHIALPDLRRVDALRSLRCRREGKAFKKSITAGSISLNFRVRVRVRKTLAFKKNLQNLTRSEPPSKPKKEMWMMLLFPFSGRACEWIHESPNQISSLYIKFRELDVKSVGVISFIKKRPHTLQRCLNSSKSLDFTNPHEAVIPIIG